MQKYYGTKVYARVDGEAVNTNIDSFTPLYLASDVDARIAAWDAIFGERDAQNAADWVAGLLTQTSEQASRIAELEQHIAKQEDGDFDLSRRVAELERRLTRINAINDNPAVFNAEIDELSTLGKDPA